MLCSLHASLSTKSTLPTLTLWWWNPLFCIQNAFRSLNLVTQETGSLCEDKQARLCAFHTQSISPADSRLHATCLLSPWVAGGATRSCMSQEKTLHMLPLSQVFTAVERHTCQEVFSHSCSHKDCNKAVESHCRHLLYSSLSTSTAVHQENSENGRNKESMGNKSS